MTKYLIIAFLMIAPSAMASTSLQIEGCAGSNCHTWSGTVYTEAELKQKPRGITYERIGQINCFKGHTEFHDGHEVCGSDVAIYYRVGKDCAPYTEYGYVPFGTTTPIPGAK